MEGFTFFFLFLTFLLFLVKATRWVSMLRAIVWLGGLVLLTWMIHTWPTSGSIILLQHTIVHMDQPLRIGRLVLHTDNVARAGIHLALAGAIIGSMASLVVPPLRETISWLAVGFITLFVAVSIISPWAWGWGVALWAIGALMVAYGGWPTSARLGWQWLLLPMLSAILLFALLAQETLDITPWRVHIITLFLLGFSNLAPFHVGGVHLAEEGQPFGLLWGLWTHTVLFLIVLYRIESTSVYQESLWRATPFLETMAYLTLIWAGIGGLAHRHIGRLSGYALAFNWALSLLLWLTYPNNLDIIRWTMAVRLIGIVSVSVGLLSFLPGAPLAMLASIKGWARRRTWGVLLWTLGIATLAGLPFTAGGWLLWIMPSMEIRGASLWLMLLGSIGLLIGLGRALTVLWSTLDTPLLPREEGITRWGFWLLSMTIIILGLFPSLVLHLGRWLVG